MFQLLDNVLGRVLRERNEETLLFCWNFIPFLLPLNRSMKTLFLADLSQKDKEKNGNKEGIKEN